MSLYTRATVPEDVVVLSHRPSNPSYLTQEVNSQAAEAPEQLSLFPLTTIKKNWFPEPELDPFTTANVLCCTSCAEDRPRSCVTLGPTGWICANCCRLLDECGELSIPFAAIDPTGDTT